MSNDLSKQVKNQIDILAVAQLLSIGKATYKANICCPFHDDSSPSFRFYSDEKGGHFKCFSNPECNNSGSDIFALIQKAHGCDFKTALHFLADHLGVEREGKKIKKTPEEDAVGLANYFFRKNMAQSKAMNYANARGITESSIDTFSIGYALPGNRLLKYGHKHKESLLTLSLIGVNTGDRGEYDFFRDRIIFPIHSPHGKLIGFSGRVLDDRKPKYLNSVESSLFSKSSTIYNLSRISHSYKHVIVVEGYLDVIGLWQAGFKNAVCTMGISLSQVQLDLLLARFDSIIFMLDGDKAGKTGAWSIAKSLIPFTNTHHSYRFVFLNDGVDPFDLSKNRSYDEIEAMLDSALFLSDFIIEEVRSMIDIRSSNPEQLKALTSQFEVFINLAPPGLFRDVVANEIANITNSSISKIPCIEIHGDYPSELLNEIDDIILARYKNTKLTTCLSNKLVFDFLPNNLKNINKDS